MQLYILRGNLASDPNQPNALELDDTSPDSIPDDNQNIEYSPETKTLIADTNAIIFAKELAKRNNAQNFQKFEFSDSIPTVNSDSDAKSEKSDSDNDGFFNTTIINVIGQPNRTPLNYLIALQAATISSPSDKTVPDNDGLNRYNEFKKKSNPRFTRTASISNIFQTSSLSEIASPKDSVTDVDNPKDSRSNYLIKSNLRAN